MKTLDEVITAMENLTTCDDTGFSYIAHDDAVDALHYLVEYRACQQHMEVVEQIRQDAVRQRDAHIKALANLNRNEPLTWDELRQMEGKPVWVMDSNGQGEWVLLSGMEGDELFFVYRTCNEYKLYREEQGERWQAYRKELS